MGLIDRYLFRQVFFACASTVGFFVFVLMAANALKDLLGVLLSGRLAVGSAVELLLLLVPYAAMYALPMGVLCGVLLVLGRLSAESEVTALRAAGLGVLRISAPIYIFAALGAVCALAVNFHYMPRARVRYQQEFANMVGTDPMKVLVPRTFVREFPKMIVYVGGRKGEVLNDVWLWQLDRDQRAVRLYRAETGRIAYNREAKELVFTPTSGTAEIRDAKTPEDFSKDPVVTSWDGTSVRFPLDGLFGNGVSRQKLELLTMDELRAERERLDGPVAPAELQQRERERMRVRMVVQEKLAMAVAVFSFALIAVPLGIKVSRRETSANLGVAVGLALTYYFLTVVVKWLDKSPQLRPDLLLWVPNVLFVMAGVWLTRKVERA